MITASPSSAVPMYPSERRARGRSLLIDGTRVIIKPEPSITAPQVRKIIAAVRKTGLAGRSRHDSLTITVSRETADVPYKTGAYEGYTCRVFTPDAAGRNKPVPAADLHIDYHYGRLSWGIHTYGGGS